MSGTKTTWSVEQKIALQYCPICYKRNDRLAQVLTCVTAARDRQPTLLTSVCRTNDGRFGGKGDWGYHKRGAPSIKYTGNDERGRIRVRSGTTARRTLQKRRRELENATIKQMKASTCAHTSDQSVRHPVPFNASPDVACSGSAWSPTANASIWGNAGLRSSCSQEGRVRPRPGT